MAAIKRGKMRPSDPLSCEIAVLWTEGDILSPVRTYGP